MLRRAGLPVPCGHVPRHQQGSQAHRQLQLQNLTALPAGLGSLAALRFIKRICEEDAAPEIKVPRMPQTSMRLFAGGEGGLLEMLFEYA